MGEAEYRSDARVSQSHPHMSVTFRVEREEGPLELWRMGYRPDTAEENNGLNIHD